MKILILILLALSSFLQNSFSDGIHNYKFSFIETVPVGDEEGKIGWNIGGEAAGGYAGPFTFYISPDEMIYIPDYDNKRINIYDIQLNYLTTVIESGGKENYWVGKISIDNDHNIILLKSNGLKKIDPEGNEIFFIKRDDLPDEVMGGRNYFPLDDYVFFYDDHGYVRSITPTGHIQKPGRSMQILTEMSLQARSVAKEGLSEEKTQLSNTISQDRKHILISDKLFSTSDGKTLKYFKTLREKGTRIKSIQAELNGGLDIDIKKIRIESLFSYDEDHNSYWECTEKATKKLFILIYSKYGKILDAFYYGDVKNLEAYKTTLAKIAIAPNGDVYFMVNDKDGSHFWKVERKW